MELQKYFVCCLIHIYLRRLTPPYALVLALTATWFGRITTGPFYKVSVTKPRYGNYAQTIFKFGKLFQIIGIRDERRQMYRL